MVVPLLWALVGASAAVALGVREDTGLLISGLVGSAALFARGSADKDALVTARRFARFPPTSGVR